MAGLNAIQKHMPVVGSDGAHVGTVDHLEDQRIELTRTDPDAQGQHHDLHVDSIPAAANGEVRLNRTAAPAMDAWAAAN